MEHTAAPALDTLAEFSNIKLEDTDEIVLGGRTFVINERTTSRQDMYVMKRLDDAGLEAISATYNTPDKLDTLAIKLIEEAYEKGTLYEILAGILVEKGVKWTRDGALKNAEFFSDLDDPDEKAKLHGPLVSILLIFFVSGAASRATSQKSTQSSDATPSQAPSSPHPSASPDASGAALTFATGPTSSETSPDTTPTDTNAS